MSLRLLPLCSPILSYINALISFPRVPFLSQLHLGLSALSHLSCTRNTLFFPGASLSSGVKPLILNVLFRDAVPDTLLIINNKDRTWTLTISSRMTTQCHNGFSWLKVWEPSPTLSVLACLLRVNSLNKDSLCMHTVYNIFSDSGGKTCHFEMEYQISQFKITGFILKSKHS